MSKLLELQEKRANIWEQAKAFLDKKQAAGDTLSTEDAAAYDKMEADVIALGKEIDRLKTQAAIDLELSKPTSSAIVISLQNKIQRSMAGSATPMHPPFGTACAASPVRKSATP